MLLVLQFENYTHGLATEMAAVVNLPKVGEGGCFAA